MFRGIRGVLRKRIEQPKIDYPSLFIKEPRHFVILPTIADVTKVDFKYPLLEPLVYAHVVWDQKEKKIVYNVVEPRLAAEEETALKKLESAISEMIDVKISEIKNRAEAVVYLEGLVQKLLVDMQLALPPGTYLKLIYYIIRDFVGLNEIDPLMYDPYIEDIGCTGVNSEIYIIHRKFGSIITNVVYKDMDYLSNFIIKLSERCGRYISYATPLLDGSLPDGSRVQASFAKDVTTKGPTFSIRKFRKNPFSPIDLLNLGTVSPSMLAYLWFLIQSNVSVLVCGGVSTGKCISADDYIQLADGEIIKAEELHNRVLEEKKPKKLLTLSDNPLKIEPTNVNKFWRLESDRLYSIKTRRGISISTTNEHPFYCLRNGEIKKTRADRIKKGDWIASARYLPIKGNKQKINLFKYDLNFYVNNRQEFLNKLLKLSGKSKKQIARQLNVKYTTFLEWFNTNSIPIKELNKFIKLTNSDMNEVYKNIKIISSKYGKKIKNITELSPEISRIIGYVIADGNIDRNTVNFHNSNKELREFYSDLVENAFGIKPKTKYYPNRTPRVQIYSSVISEIFNKVFNIPNRKKANIATIPTLLTKATLKEVSGFLSALFDCESYVSDKECEIEFSTSSEAMAKQMPYLLQRFGIITMISTKRIKNKTYYRIRISGSENLKLFRKHIGYKHSEKNKRLEYILGKTQNYITNVDLVPINKIIREVCHKNAINHSQLARVSNLKRESIRDIIKEKVNPQRRTLKKIAHGFLKLDVKDPLINYLIFLADSDIFWDRVKEINVKPNDKKYVYDVTVDGTHNFVAGNFGGLIISNTTMLNVLSMFIPPENKIVSIEDTREINLPHPNWIPSVARTGFGVPGESGKRYGEIDLFDLLKESFRMNPDYVVVGEVRGKEAYVMFQGISSGHPSLGTIHAGSVDDVIKRLETPPIELSPSLIESLDILIVMVNAKEKGKSARRIKEIVEIQSLDVHTGRAHTLKTFAWMPGQDAYKESVESSEVLRRISFEKGMSFQGILNELDKREKILEWMRRHEMANYIDVTSLINLYYKDPKTILEWVEKDVPPQEDKMERIVKSKLEPVTGLRIIKD